MRSDQVKEIEGAGHVLRGLACRANILEPRRREVLTRDSVYLLAIIVFIPLRQVVVDPRDGQLAAWWRKRLSRE